MIDFGGCAVGDPACDLAMGWSFFTGSSRGAFLSALDVDEATRARGRGWALWKALITLAQGSSTAETARLRFGWRWPVPDVLDQILDKH